MCLIDHSEWEGDVLDPSRAVHSTETSLFTFGPIRGMLFMSPTGTATFLIKKKKIWVGKFQGHPPL